jgi:hypothetical protein
VHASVTSSKSLPWVHRFVGSLRVTACPGCFGLRLDQVIRRRPHLADRRRYLVGGQLKHVVGID